MDSVNLLCGGRKYIKVKSFEDKIMTDYDENGGDKTLHKDTKGSIHCFVEKRRVIYSNSA